MRAEKKIELQDIEEDNLKSERDKDYDKPNQHVESSIDSGAATPLDFLKGGFLRYFENSGQQQQSPRYVHQYSVTETPERPPPVVPPPKPHYLPSAPASAPQQAMVGYLSNVPMQIYLVPQYYNEVSEGSASGHSGVQYTATPPGARVAAYPTASEAVQTQSNYIEVPAYAPPTSSRTYGQQYTQNVPAYVGYSAQPTHAPTASPTIAPVVTYQIPVVQYQTAGVVTQPQAPPNGHYYQAPHYTETNAVEEVQETDEENSKQYTHAEVSYTKAPNAEFPRYYTSRQPPREEYRYNHITELPHPSPLLLKPHPPHLAHIPKALPSYRPASSKPIYGPSNHIPGPLIRPSEPFGVPSFKRRPISLLDSYIPSSVQLEYMKRGYTNDPLVAYEALSSGRHFSNSPLPPRHFERGFLPNQMYHTAAGGVTFGHYKRTPKVDKPAYNQ